MLRWTLASCFFMASAMAANPTAISHSGSPLRLAESLAHTIENLSREARTLSYSASDPREARKLVELSEEADNVQRDVDYRIVRDLEKGVPLDQVARNFEPVRTRIQFLQRLAQALRTIPYSLNIVLSDMENKTRSLYRVLNNGQGGGGSGITAVCEEHTEHNAFTGAKTYVTCDFRGRGLTKYEVLLNYGSTNLNGHLYPELAHQNIKTESVRAGLWPKFEVFVTDTFNRRTLVSKNH